MSFSAVYITGIIAGIMFVLNFATCLVMPWARKNLCGECQGKNEEYCKITCHPFSFSHRPIAWLTLIAVLVHIIVAIVY